MPFSPVSTLFRSGKHLAFLLAFLLPCSSQALPEPPSSTVELGGSGWRLWLDRKAEWKNDELHWSPTSVEGSRLIIPDLENLPEKPPTGGWEKLFADSRPPAEVTAVYADSNLCLEVKVPGTVEEYFWDAISGKQKGANTSGDYVGVSWWGREFDVPASAKGKRVKLFFAEGVRLRAEVYVNRKLVSYSLAEQMPLEMDITDAVTWDASNQLAVRITDPGGNFSWGDYVPFKWGDYSIPLTHGFGGILGPVRLVAVDPVHVSDLFVKNKPAITEVDLEVEAVNDGTAAASISAELEIVEATEKGKPITDPKVVFRKALGSAEVAPGKIHSFSGSASVPGARVWGIREGNLYRAVITLRDNKGRVLDRFQRRFGFRWFAVEGYGTESVCFKLNGKRQTLLSAISWGFWPVNGIYPTPELARKHIESAFALGQNMLNFHRCPGNTQVLDLADELGILYYEEPGAYSCGFGPATRSGDYSPKAHEFPVALAREKFLRMVRRDRNHPSLVIYNMVNEPGYKPTEVVARDMADAHRIDPTRFISYGSGFMAVGEPQPIKLHMLPYDDKQSTVGYCDIHNAGAAEGVYLDSYYHSPKSFLRDLRPRSELFVWGEEGAIATPPQLELIQQEISKGGLRGWDGSDYLDWHRAYVDYIKAKKLEAFYPSLTGLITSLGDIMYYEHGRLLENVRIADTADLYVLNGYEDMKLDNISGAVDCYRNLKGRPELIRQYMRPLMVAVKAREKIGHVGDQNLLDFFVLNEQVLPAGEYQLKATLQRPDGKTLSLVNTSARVSGGDKYSDLAAEAVPVLLDSGTGYYKITARLEDRSGKLLADGHEELFAVNWKSDKLAGKGAILYAPSDLKRFLSADKKVEVVPYDESLGRLDYILVCGQGGAPVLETIPFHQFRAKDGVREGLTLDYFKGTKFEQQIDSRVLPLGIHFNHKAETIPGYDILGDSDWSLRWEGFLVPDHSGPTEFEFSFDDGARLWLDGELLVDQWRTGPAKHIQFSRELQAGRRYALKIEFVQKGGGWLTHLKWKVPQTEKEADIDQLLKRVREDGTKLLLLADADKWAAKLKDKGAFPNHRLFRHAKSWVGGNYFVHEHALFEGLPVNGAMNWEYQRLVMYNGPAHFGFYDMQGEEAVVSCVGAAAHLVATSVGILPLGKGEILFSSLNLLPNLTSKRKADDVPRKVFCNYLKWAGSKP